VKSMIYWKRKRVVVVVVEKIIYIEIKIERERLSKYRLIVVRWFGRR